MILLLPFKLSLSLYFGPFLSVSTFLPVNLANWSNLVVLPDVTCRVLQISPSGDDVTQDGSSCTALVSWTLQVMRTFVLSFDSSQA